MSINDIDKMGKPMVNERRSYEDMINTTNSNIKKSSVSFFFCLHYDHMVIEEVALYLLLNK